MLTHLHDVFLCFPKQGKLYRISLQNNLFICLDGPTMEK